MPSVFDELAAWTLREGYISTLIRGQGGDFMAPGSENAMTTGQGLTRAFRGMHFLPLLAGSRVFFNCDQSFAGLGSAVTPGSVLAASLADGGDSYAVGDTGTVNGGDGLAAYEVLTVDGDGAVLTFSIVSPGTGYAVAENIETTNDGAQPGVGVGFKINVTSVSGGGRGSVFKVQDLLCYIGDGQVAFDGHYLTDIIATSTLSLVKKSGMTYAAGPLTGPFQAGHVQPSAPVIFAKTPPSAGQVSMNAAVSVVVWRLSSLTGQPSLMSEPSNVLSLTDSSVIVTIPDLPDTNGQDYWGIGVVKIGFADLGWYYELPTSRHGEVAETELATIDGHARAVEISWTNGHLLSQNLAPDKAFPPPPADFAGTMNDVAWLDAAGIIYVGEPGFIGSFPPSNALFASEPAVVYVKVNDGLTVRLGKTSVGTLYYVGGSPALEYQVILENQGIELPQNACIGAHGRLLAWMGRPVVIDSDIEPDFEYAADVLPDFEGWNSQTSDTPVVVGFDNFGGYECWFYQQKCMAKYVAKNTWCAPLDLSDEIQGNALAAVTVRNKLYICSTDGLALFIYQFDAGTGSIMKVQTSDLSLFSYFCNLSLVMGEVRADNTDNPFIVEVVKNYDDENPVADPLSVGEATPTGVGEQLLCPRQPNILDLNQLALRVTVESQGGDCGINRLIAFGPRWEVLRHQCVAGKLSQAITFTSLENKCSTDADFTVSATASSGLIVSWSIAGPAELTDNEDGTATVHLTGELGIVTVTAHQAGNDIYDRAPSVEQQFNVVDCNQAQFIVFSMDVSDRCTTDEDFLVEATSSSGLTVSFTVDGPATLTDHGDGTATVHLTGDVGVVTITAHQTGDEDFDAAPDVERSFNVIVCGVVQDCTPNTETPMVFGTLQNVINTDGVLTRSGGTANTNDAFGYSSRFVEGNRCAYWEWYINFNNIKENNRLYYVIEDEFGTANRYGWHFTNQILTFRRTPYHGTIADNPAIYYGPMGEPEEGQIGFTVGYRFAIWYNNGDVTLYENTQFAHDTNDIHQGPLAGGLGSFRYHGLPTDRRWRLKVYVFPGAAQAQTSPVFESITE